MNTHVFIRRSAGAARRRVGCARTAVLAAVTLLSSFSFAASAPPLVRMNQIMWHQVVDQRHQTLGYVSDLLLEMPSGRILYVAVEPQDLFQQSKVISPGALSLRNDGTLQFNQPFDGWANAPRLSPNGRKIEQFTRNGVQLRAHYDEAWTSPAPKAAQGLEVVAPLPGAPQPARFVSMQRLANNPVMDENRQSLGAVGGFLVDWPEHRAVYALVANDNAGASSLGGVSNGYAVPTVMLTPPHGDRSIVINSTPGALSRAPLLTGNNNWQRNPVQVYRFRSSSNIAATARPAARRR